MLRSEEPTDCEDVPPGESSQMYLVFESAILSLLAICSFCFQHSVQVKKQVIGSMLRIACYCRSCGQTRKWDSQPFIGNTPAGNIKMSAAILCSGSTPEKSLRLFDFLHCSSITPRTYFRHQKIYLSPAIEAIWNAKQHGLLSKFIDSNTSLSLSGDGRCDSPGHSAKFGSYSFVELTCNQVVHFELLQVIASFFNLHIYMPKYNAII